MKSPFLAHTVGALAFLGITSISPLVNAGAPSTCDDISKDVKEAVSKDPSKVLMIVEDALVINESCACEIIKAAILASSADAAMVRQIVQTGLAVAPKMSAIITECANAVAPGSGDAIAVAGEKEKPSGKQPANVLPPEVAEGTDFGNAWATNIRGVYLIQPAAAGFVTQTDDSSDKKVIKHTKEKNDDDANDTDDNPDRANSRRTRNLVALSPTNAHP